MTRKLSIIVGVSVLAWGAQARAQYANDPDQQTPSTTTTTTTTTSPSTTTTYQNPPAITEEPGMYSYAWREPRLQSEIGVGVILGGGIMGFTDAAMRDVTRSNIGGLWDLRLSLGTHMPIGLDVSYVGTASGLQTITGARNGTLIGSAVEGAVRFNVLPHFDWDPYVFAGAGWQRYDVMSEKFAFSDTGMRNLDNLIVFPMGGGLSYRDLTGFMVDLRGTFRAAINNDLLLRADGSKADLHTWEASAALGYEF